MNTVEKCIIKNFKLFIYNMHKYLNLTILSLLNQTILILSINFFKYLHQLQKHYFNNYFKEMNSNMNYLLN